MSSRAVPHELAQRRIYGTPRGLPTVLLCHATERYCGRAPWVANTWPEYERAEAERRAHEVFCATRAQLAVAR